MMSEIKELINQIEELRKKMIKIKEGKSFIDPEVLAASRKLDEVLDKYHVMISGRQRRDSSARAENCSSPEQCPSNSD
jgi:hypothetical protein